MNEQTFKNTIILGCKCKAKQDYELIITSNGRTIRTIMNPREYSLISQAITAMTEQFVIGSKDPITSLYCVEVNRGGIGEEDYIFHTSFTDEPSRKDILREIKIKDIGYDDNYCSFKYYKV